MSTEKQTVSKIEKSHRGSGSSTITVVTGGHSEGFHANYFSGDRFYIHMEVNSVELRIQYGKRLSDGLNELPAESFGLEYKSPAGGDFDNVTGGTISVTVSGGTFNGELKNVTVTGSGGTARFYGTYNMTV